MEAFPGVFETPWFGLAEGSVIPGRKPAGPSAVRHPTSNAESQSGQDTEDWHVTRRDPRRDSRCAPAQSRNPCRTFRTQSEKAGIRRGRTAWGITG